MASRAAGWACTLSTLVVQGLLAQSVARGGIQSPILLAVDSVDLIENDSQFVGRSIGFAVSTRGNLYISDDLNTIVHEFSPRGDRLRSFGGRGRGPGEFTSVGFVATDADSGLIVDGGTYLHYFDLRSGKLKWQRLPPAKMIQAMLVHRGNIVVNAIVGRDPSRAVSLASVRSLEDAARYGGPLPAPLGRSPVVDQSFGVLQFTFFNRDSLAVAVTASSDFLFFGLFDSPRFDSVHVARSKRRGGLSSQVLAKFLTNPASVTAVDLFQPSTPWALAALSSGDFAYVTLDPELTNNRITGPLYVSIVDARSRRTCPDARVPVPTDPQPRVTFRADTLFVLSQDETADKKPRTTLRKFMIRTENCRWLP